MRVEPAHGTKTQYRRLLTLLARCVPLMAPPEAVAKVIGRALSVGSPRARYLVGRDTQGILVGDTLAPTCVKDRLARLVTGL